MARDETIIYGNSGSEITIGGASSSAPIPIDRFEWDADHKQARFLCDFLVTAASYSAFATAVQAVETGLCRRRQRLQVKFGATTLLDYDPASAAATGLNARPRLRKLRELGTGYGRKYRFEAVVDLPASDQSGREDESWSVRTDLENRRVITLEGVYTAMPNFTAYAQYSAQISTHADAIKAIVDNSATWVLAESTATPNDANSRCDYRHVYVEVVGGRRNSHTDIKRNPAGTRTVTISGQYLKTGASSAKTLYDANEATHSGAVLDALGITSSNRELIEEQLRPNEKDESLSFTRVYQELIHQQSSGLTNDPDVVGDRVSIGRRRLPANDSPPPKPIQTGGGSGGGAPGGQVSTRDRGADAAGTGIDLPAQGATEARPLVEILISYEAWIINTNMDLRGKWEDSLRSHVISSIAARLSVTPVSVAEDSFSVDPVNNRIQASLRLTAAESGLLGFTVTDSYDRDFGIRLTGVLSGEEDEYLVQKGFSRRTRTREITAVYLTSSGFSPQRFESPGGSYEGWVLTRRTHPQVKTLTVGVPGLTVGQLSMTVVTFREEFTYVRRRVTRGGNGSSAPGGYVSTGQTVSR